MTTRTHSNRPTRTSGPLRAAAAAGALVLAVLGTGCATPATSSNMTLRAQDATATQGAVSEAMRGSVAVKEVTGGKETNPMWVSNVGSAQFEQALQESLRSVGLLSANRQAGRYELVAHLDKLDQPLFGLDMTVTAKVTYTLVERASGKTVMQKSFSTPYTAKMGDAFVGTERLRLANEGAVRQNIAQLIAELTQFKVSEVTLR